MLIYKNNLKRIFRSKARVLVIFLLPILFALLFMSDSNRTSVKMVIIDYDQSELSKRLTEEMEIQNIVVEGNEKTARDSLIIGMIDYEIIIPEGFEEDIISGKEVKINELYFIDSLKLYGTKAYLENYVTNLKLLATNTASKEEFYKYLDSQKDDYYSIDTKIIEEKSTDEATGGIGFMIQFIIYMSITTAVFLIIDKEKNTIVRLATSPLSRSQYLFENLLSFLTVGLIQLAVVFAFYMIYMKFYFGEQFIFVVLLMILFTIVSIVLSMLVVTFAKSEKVAYGIVVVAATPYIMLAGCYFDIDTMPELVQKFAKFLPTFWAMDGAKKLIMTGKVGDIWTNCIVLLTFAVTFFIISIVDYSVKSKLF